MEPEAPGAAADVAVADAAAADADATVAADVEDSNPAPPPSTASLLSTLIAAGKVQDGEVLRCVKVRDRCRNRDEREMKREGIDLFFIDDS